MSAPSPTPRSGPAPLGTHSAAAEAPAASSRLLAVGGLLAAGPFLLAAAALRVLRPEVFPWGAAQVDHGNALLSAAVLVAAALAATAAALLTGSRGRRLARALCLAALLFGTVFLLLRYQQSMELFQRGLAWGDGFRPTAAQAVRPAPAPLEPLEPAAPAAADPDATTVPPPAPAPLGLAQGARNVPAPPHAGLYFGLFHLLSLVASLLVLTAMAGALRSAFSRGAPGTRSGGVFPWQLAAGVWLLTTALLLSAGAMAEDLALTGAIAAAALLLLAPAGRGARATGLLAMGTGMVVLLALGGLLTLDAAGSREAVERYRRPPLIEKAEDEAEPVPPAEAGTPGAPATGAAAPAQETPGPAGTPAATPRP